MWWPRRRVYVDNLPKTHDGRFLLLFFVMFFAALGGVYVVGYVAAGDKVPARTTVGGVEVGSMSRQEAHDLLVRDFAARLAEPLTVAVGGRTTKLIPKDQGMSFDVEATLDEAMGGTDWNPHHMLKVVEGGGPVDPIFRADPIVLAHALQPLADRVERAPVDTMVAVRAGRPVVTAGHPGVRLDVGSAAESVVAALQDHQGSVTIRLDTVPPVIDEAAATAFVDDELGPALSHPAVVALGGDSLSVTPAEFGPALDVVQSDGTLRLRILSSVLWTRTHALVGSVPGRPVDARVVFKDGRPTVVAGRAGTQVDPASWAKAVFAAVQSAQHRAKAAVTTVQPDVTTSDARAYSITTEIASATGTAEARLAGALSLAAHNLDATVVLPGASFSYAHEVGQSSVATVLGPLGSTTQEAAVRADMTITRWPAVSPVGHDLGFRNTTDHPVLIHCWVAPRGAGRTAIFVQFWGSPGH